MWRFLPWAYSAHQFLAFGSQAMCTKAYLWGISLIAACLLLPVWKHTILYSSTISIFCTVTWQLVLLIQNPYWIVVPYLFFFFFYIDLVIKVPVWLLQHRLPVVIFMDYGKLFSSLTFEHFFTGFTESIEQTIIFCLYLPILHLIFIFFNDIWMLINACISLRSMCITGRKVRWISVRDKQGLLGCSETQMRFPEL